MNDQQTLDQREAATPQTQAEQEKAGSESVKLPFWRQMLSVLQASFGVQSRENKERDFASGSIWGFVGAALIFTVAFVLGLIFIVNLVIG